MTCSRVFQSGRFPCRSRISSRIPSRSPTAGMTNPEQPVNLSNFSKITRAGRITSARSSSISRSLILSFRLSLITLRLNLENLCLSRIIRPWLNPGASRSVFPEKRPIAVALPPVITSVSTLGLPSLFLRKSMKSST